MLAVCCCAGPAGAVAATDGRFRVLYAEPVVMTGLDAVASPGTGVRQRARFDAYGRRFELLLEPNARLLAGLDPHARHAAAGVRLLRGRVVGADGSWVRLAQAGARLSGMVWDGTDLYVIEPADEVQPRAPGPLGVSGSLPVVYRLSDTVSDPLADRCLVVEPDRPVARQSGLDDYLALVSELRVAAAAGSLRGRLQVSAVADFEYYRLASSADVARSRILTIFNNVDGIYSAQVGIQLELTGEITVFENNADPFSTSAPETLLRQLGEYRASQPVLRSTGVTHLLTGRDLDGNTVGIAYLGALCLNQFGSALTQGNASLVSLVVAHEIGHNFGAPHDGEATGPGEPANPCATVPRTFLMAPQVNGSDQFSQCSLTEMELEIASARCILPALLGADLALSTTSGSVTATIGQSAVLRASVANVGSATAENLRLTFSVPAGLGAVAGSATAGGSCVTQAGGIVCDWNSLGAGITTSVTIDLRADAAGSYTVPAALAAAADASSGNDSVAYQVVVASSEPPPLSSSSKGGGGRAAGAFVLLALLAAARRRSWAAQPSSARSASTKRQASSKLL